MGWCVCHAKVIANKQTDHRLQRNNKKQKTKTKTKNQSMVHHSIK